MVLSTPVPESAFSRIVAAVLVSGFLYGCSTSGTKFSPDEIPRIKRGQTSQAEVKEIFGEPTRLRVDAGGRTQFSYVYVETRSLNSGFFVRMANFVMRILGRGWIPAPFNVGHKNRIEHRLRVDFNTNQVVSNYVYERVEQPTTTVY